MPVRPSTGDDSALLRKELQESKADREQIRRLITSIPKPKAVVPGGGIVGATFATPSGTQSISRGSGFSSIFVDGWTFDTSVTSDQPTGPALTAASQDFGPTDEGWYGLDLRVRVIFPSGTPPKL